MRDVHRRPLACTQKIQKGYLQAELAIENIPNKGYHDKDIHDTLPLYSQWQEKERERRGGTLTKKRKGSLTNK